MKRSSDSTSFRLHVATLTLVTLSLLATVAVLVTDILFENSIYNQVYASEMRNEQFRKMVLDLLTKIPHGAGAP